MVKGYLSRNLKIVNVEGEFDFFRLHLLTFDEAAVESGVPGFLPIVLKHYCLSSFTSESPGIIYVDSPLLLEETAEGNWRLSPGDSPIS